MADIDASPPFDLVSGYPGGQFFVGAFRRLRGFPAGVEKRQLPLKSAIERTANAR